MAQDSDVSLKYLFRYSKGILADMLFGPGPREFLNVELPQITNRRIDTVTRCADGMLRHAEFEGENRPNTQRRFTEYYLALHRLFDEHVQLTMVWTGKKRLRMRPVFKTPDLTYRFRVLNIRDFDGDPLLASPDWGDNIMALLTKVDQEKAMDKVDSQLRGLHGEEQQAATVIYWVVSGIIGIEESVRRRTNMITMEEMMKNKIIGPMLRESREIGEAKGAAQGRRAMLGRQLRQRFGAIPARIARRLESATPEQLEAAADRVLTATSISEVFGPRN